MRVHQSQGYTLIECGIALLLSAGLLVILLQIYQSVWMAAKLAQAQSSLFQRALFISQYFPIKLKKAHNQLAHLHYFVLPLKRSIGKKVVMGLFEEVDGHNRIELEEGVDSVKVYYAVKNSAQAIRYLRGHEISHWDKVIAMILNFKLSSIERLGYRLEPLTLNWQLYVAIPHD